MPKLFRAVYRYKSDANNILVMEGRTKSSGLQRDSRINSWIWCMFIAVFCLSFIFTECYGDRISLTVFPSEDPSILYGNPLEILCAAEHGYTSQDLEFLLGDKHLNESIVNDTTVRLFLEKPDIGAYVFLCRNRKTDKVSASRVIVDTLPPFVTSFKCISQNLDQLECSWVRPTSHLYTAVNQTLSFLVNGRQVLPCHVVREDNVSSCTWYSSHGQPVYRQQLEKYLFKMKSCNSVGCINEDFAIDHYSIVKPNKPTDLDVIHCGTHSVILKWRISNNMVDLLPGGIEHRIEYQVAGIDEASYFREVDATDLPPKNRSYEFELTYLPYANQQYEVRIYVRPKKAKGEEFWSDYAFKIINTTSERPQRPPKIAAGAFHQMVYKNHRLINMYWSRLQGYEEAGANYTHKVVISQGETVFPESKSILHKNYMSLINATLDYLQVSVWSQNAIGTSENYSSLYIPPLADTEALSLKSFTVLKHSNGTYELSWDKMNNIDNYTLFWCELETANICADQMNFKTLQSDVSKQYIHFLPQVTAYQFAMSVNNGTISSGMTWAECDIARGQIGLFVYGVCEMLPQG